MSSQGLSSLYLSLSGSFFIQARVSPIWLHLIIITLKILSPSKSYWKISLRLHPINPTDRYKSSCSHVNTHITDFGGWLRWWWNDQSRIKRVRFCQSYSSQSAISLLLLWQDFEVLFRWEFSVKLFPYCFLDISPQFWDALLATSFYKCETEVLEG